MNPVTGQICRAVTAFEMLLSTSTGTHVKRFEKGDKCVLSPTYADRKLDIRNVRFLFETQFKPIHLGLLFEPEPEPVRDDLDMIGDELFMFRPRGAKSWTSCPRATYDTLQALEHVETMVVRPVRKEMQK